MCANAYIMLSNGNRKSIMVRMPEVDVEKLNLLAEKRRMSREAIIRECILEKFAKLDATVTE